MGKKFGNLAVIRGLLTYKISPFEQKPYAGALTHELPNLVPWITANILRYMPAFILGSLTYLGIEEAHRLSLRKNPKDYLNEVDPNPDPCKDRKKKSK